MAIAAAAVAATREEAGYDQAVFVTDAAAAVFHCSLCRRAAAFIV